MILVLIYLCNESMPNEYMLLYADGVAMVDDTIGRLQRQLNIISEFLKCDLNIKMYKTNVMVLRNYVFFQALTVYSFKNII